MKVFVLAIAFLSTAAFAEHQNVDIDWSTVKPIEHYPAFWDNKPASLRPPQEFFDKLEKEPLRNGRIVGGNIATEGQFPYQAAVLMFIASLGGSALCGGSLIGTSTILTAAHCVENASNGTIVLGAHFLTIPTEPHQVRIAITNAAVAGGAIVMYPGWEPSLIRNDVAIVHLPHAPTLSPRIQPANLPFGIPGDLNGENGVVSGWGVFSDAQGTASDVLRFVYDNIIPNSQCNLRFPGVIQDTNICVTGTQGRGACSGDSGGPLTIPRNGVTLHVGIVSFGLALGCERSWPSVFARTTEYLPWIQTHLR